MEVQMFSSSLGAMGSLLGKLGSLLVSPGDQLPDTLKPQKEKLQILKQDLEEMNTMLGNLSRVQALNTMGKLWMNEVRDLSYDMEDYIDKTMSPSNTGEKNQEIPFEIEEFVTLVKHARDRYSRYDLGRWASSPAMPMVADGQVRLPTLSGQAITDLVGINDATTKLIKLLSNDAEQGMKVVSVLGPAGVGKSTLAKQVYRQMGGKFDCRAFVRASRMPDTRRLLRSIISQVQRHQRPPHGLPVQELIDNLREHLQQKRYFILIDGLWETTSWDIVYSAFPEGAHCSRILVTTEIEEVALECCDYQYDGIFKMRPLSRTDSIELLFNRIFGSKHECSEQVKEVSEEIIKKCGGLPLAVICIASILVSQPANSELWQHVSEWLSGSMRNNHTSQGMLREIVAMSYNNLPDHLKTCLLYLSMYPEGYTFLKTDLVKQWMAEGFISTVHENASKVAESYFDELVCRGLIQPNHINFSDTMVSYTVHSCMFEVIRFKSIEENFIILIDYSNTIPELSAKVRRLSLRYSNAEYATKPEGIMLSPVRSLIFYGLVECLPSIMEFEVLRVLILEIWGDQEELDVSGIDRLFQLRYVQITTDIVVKLPAKMSGLQYLETLEIYARVSIVPSDIVHLPKLLHFHIRGPAKEFGQPELCVLKEVPLLKEWCAPKASIGTYSSKIQASIADDFRKQSEVIGRKSTAKATAAAFVRRSRRNIRANGLSTYFRGRGRASSDDVALACSDDEEDGNGQILGKEESSAEESSPEKKQKRPPKWPTPRSSPARAACSEEAASDDKDDVGISRENFSTSPLRAWGKNGTRSQTRYSSFSGSNGRVVKGGRMIKLVERLRNSDDNDSERDIHLRLLPLDGQTTPNLEKPYLCCGPTLSIKQLCQFVASQTSHKDEDVEIYARKPSYNDLVSTNTCDFDKARLVGEERLSNLRSSFTFPNGVLELVYAIKVAN